MPKTRKKKHVKRGEKRHRAYSAETSPRWGYTMTQCFREILDKVEKEKGISLLEHALNMAYDNDKILIRFLDKLIPDVKADTNINLKGSLDLGHLSDDDLRTEINRLKKIRPGVRLRTSQRDGIKRITK